jgi:protein SCO1/2
MRNMANEPAARRGMMGRLMAMGASSLAQAAQALSPVAALAAAGTEQPKLTLEQQTRLRLREQRTPNVRLVDQDGREVRFYDDVVKGRRVLVNVKYTICSGVCTPATSNLIEARKLLADEAKDLQFVSISLTPLTDTPEALRNYKQQHGLGADWTFLTGEVEEVEKLQRAMGFITDKDGDDLLSHSAMARLADDRFMRWTHVNTLLSPRSIARMIRFENV